MKEGGLKGGGGQEKEDKEKTKEEEEEEGNGIGEGNRKTWKHGKKQTTERLMPYNLWGD